MQAACTHAKTIGYVKTNVTFVIMGSLPGIYLYLSWHNHLGTRGSLIMYVVCMHHRQRA